MCRKVKLCNDSCVCYFAITCNGSGFIKDAPFVLLCKLFRRKVVIHQHNKGMSGCVDKQPYKWLLPLSNIEPKNKTSASTIVYLLRCKNTGNTPLHVC